MMYNVARALALIGLVGVSASNATSTNTTSGSTAPPQSGGCTAWDDASGTTYLMSRRSLAADRRQLSNHTSGNSNCENDVPQCLYFFAEVDGFQVTGANASCPTSYTANDATLLKDAVKRAVCAGGDTNNCYSAVETALSFKLKCKLKSAATYTNPLAPAARRLSGTDVTMHLVAAVTLKDAKVGAFTAAKIGEALFALSQVTALAQVTKAVKDGFNAAAVVQNSSPVFSGHKTNANIAATKAAITVSNHDCQGIGKLSDYKTHCTGAAAASKAKCTNFQAGTGNNNNPSNAVSFILSSAVLAVAALI